MRALIAALVLIWASAVQAQEELDPSPILVFDFERVLSDTQFGRRVGEEFETAGNTLEMENSAIQESLEAEEQAISERRPDLTPEAFQLVAEEFDAKVQSIRRERDAREDLLRQIPSEAERRLRPVVNAVLLEIMAERGAVVVLERRDVYVSVTAVDVTELIVERVDARIGAGREVMDVRVLLQQNGPPEVVPPEEVPASEP